MEKEDDKNILYKMLVAKVCDGCSTAPLTQYKKNEIYQEITGEINIRINLQITKQMIELILI